MRRFAFCSAVALLLSCCVSAPVPAPVQAAVECVAPADCVVSCEDDCCGAPCGCRTAVPRAHAEPAKATRAARCSPELVAQCQPVACLREDAMGATCDAGRCITIEEWSRRHAPPAVPVPPAPVPPPQPSPATPAPPPSPPVEQPPPAPARPRPAVPAHLACTTSAECTISCEGDCCGAPCGCRTAMNVAAARRLKAHPPQCGPADRRRCPAVACAYEPAFGATCRDGRCVALTDGLLGPGSP
jgi:hypothetical protein